MKKGRIPEMPIFVDSPMAINTTFLYKQMPQYHKLENGLLDDSLFDYDNITYIINPDDSKFLNERKSNCIIISASGMCTGGRILHHLFHRLPNTQDTILFVGFQAIETRGQRILAGAESIKIFGENVSVRANIRKLNALSAHADADELFDWVSNIEKPKKTFVIHGEQKSSDTFAEKIRTELKWNTFVPEYLETFELFEGI